MQSRHLLLATSLAALLIALLPACGDDDEPGSSTTPTSGEETSVPDESPDSADAGVEGGRNETQKPPTAETGPVEDAEGDPRVTALERAAGRAVRRYVEALDARDGELACSLLAPGAIEQIELPRPDGGCAAPLEASIGYRDPRGLPVWKRAELARLVSVEIDGGSAKVVATVITTFADRDEPSIEDDIVYLVRGGGGWLVAKPSSTLYRAVGIADVPPSVLAPPG